MRTMEDNSVSAIVCDPPYGLSSSKKAKSGFMGKEWDAKTPDVEIWREALRIAKPGSHLLAFGGTRTFHRLACSIEDAGWSVRDCISWIYASGWPKSHNFGRQLGGDWQGYGSALKPAWEPVLVCMKPLDGTFIQNAQKHGVAGINIDDSRVDGKRWPANLILDEVAADLLDQQSGISASRPDKRSGNRAGKGGINCYAGGWKDQPNSLNDSGGASRFFFVAKASASERNQGLEGIKNIHPCIKPIKLMEYLIKLVMPPTGGILLDPFAGSGTTIVAATRLGYEAIGIEKEAEYCQIAEARVKHAQEELEKQQQQMKFAF